MYVRPLPADVRWPRSVSRRSEISSRSAAGKLLFVLVASAFHSAGQGFLNLSRFVLHGRQV